MGKVLSSKRVLLTGLVMGIVTVFWYQVFYVSQKRDIDAIERKIRDTEAVVATWVAETRHLSDYQSKYTVLEEKQERILSQIPDVHQVDQLSERLIRLGRDNGCEVSYLGIPFAEFFSKDHAAESSPGHAVIMLPFHMVARGDFPSLGRFIEALSDLPYFTAFGDFEVSRLSDDARELQMDLSMTIFLKRGGSRNGEDL